MTHMYATSEVHAIALWHTHMALDMLLEVCKASDSKMGKINFFFFFLCVCVCVCVCVCYEGHGIVNTK